MCKYIQRITEVYVDYTCMIYVQRILYYWPLWCSRCSWTDNYIHLADVFLALFMTPTILYHKGMILWITQCGETIHSPRIDANITQPTKINHMNIIEYVKVVKIILRTIWYELWNYIMKHTWIYTQTCDSVGRCVNVWRGIEVCSFVSHYVCTRTDSAEICRIIISYCIDPFIFKSSGSSTRGACCFAGCKQWN